jgi:hypothetical protein
MKSAAVTIPPRRSLAFFAVLAMLMVIGSYLLILLLAAGCVYLSWLALIHITNFQTLALFVRYCCGRAMLWSSYRGETSSERPGCRWSALPTHGSLRWARQHRRALGEPLPRGVPDRRPNGLPIAAGNGFGSRRVMGLGLPLLAALTVSQFRAIWLKFAHYYGGHEPRPLAPACGR